MRAKLSISLSAIQENYRHVAEVSTGAMCAAVVKADAYGLGLNAVAPALYEAGARTFFVALMEEGIALRALLPDAVIYVLNGVLPNEESDMRAHGLRPVLNDPENLSRWTDGPCAVQLDTGLNRLGFSVSQWEKTDLAGRDVTLILSHLACADTPEHPMNTVQRQRFEDMTARYPQVQKSLAASDGIFCGEGFHFDLVRPGAALYGINPIPNRANPMTPVVTLEAPILGIHTVEQEGSIGYAATRAATIGQRVAAIGLGYADGFFRSHSNQANLYWKGKALPVLGRVSMDIVLVDLANVPEQTPTIGDYVEVIGPSQSADQLAATAGTIGYEILTALGPRFQRVYTR